MRDSIPVPDGMRDLVVIRLVDAAKLAERTGGRVGPRQFANAWPEYMVERGDMNSQAESGELGRGGNRVRMPATSRQVTLADEAMGWPMRYVRDDRERSALALWLGCKARRRRYGRVLKSLGVAAGTARHRVDRAIHAITVGLVRDGVQITDPDGE